MLIWMQVRKQRETRHLRLLRMLCQEMLVCRHWLIRQGLQQ